jgi:hypothetical protein
MVEAGYIGPYYPGSGTALSRTVSLGRIAAKNAVAEAALTWHGCLKDEGVDRFSPV